MQAKNASKNILEQASAWANNNPTTLLVVVLVGAALCMLLLALAVFTCRRVRTRRQQRVAEVARQIDSPDPCAPPLPLEVCVDTTVKDLHRLPHQLP
jgi:hypothetical protein